MILLVSLSVALFGRTSLLPSKRVLRPAASPCLAGDAHSTAGDGNGKPACVDGGAEEEAAEAGAKEQRAVEEIEASSKLQQEAVRAPLIHSGSLLHGGCLLPR